MLDDDVLLARIATGDHEALRQLHERYYPRLRRYLLRRVRFEASAVEDALQEIFLNVWRFAATFRGQSKVTTWLFGIAYHQVLRQQRDRHAVESELRVLTSDVDGTTDTASFSTPSPEELVVDRMMLADALRKLSAKHREVLELIFTFGFSPDEAATILKIPPGTVKSRISYARRTLLQILASQSSQSSQEVRS